MGAPFCLCVNVAIFGRITEVTRHLRPAYGILSGMKTKNMRELEKMWAKKATEQSNPQKKAGTPVRQTPTHTTRAARKSSRGR
jgi:hypothetical protein